MAPETSERVLSERIDLTGHGPSQLPGPDRCAGDETVGLWRPPVPRVLSVAE